MINGSLITDRSQYFRQQGIDRQKNVVAFKSCTTVTTEALVWTYRTTNCDVTSIITTTVPFTDALMKDIQMETTEVKRLKPPMLPKSKKDLLGNSPYDFGLSVDVEKKTSKMNQMLHEEKKEFMQKLNLTRMVRSKLENDAAIRIQSAYRGYSIRSNFLEISRFANVNRMIRLNIRTYLEAVNYPTSRLRFFRNVREQLRNHSAVIIRGAFLRYLSRQYVRRRQYELELRKKHRSATIIQARIRGGYARTRVMALIEKRRMIQCFLAAVKIQSAFRRMNARRRVHRRRFRIRWIAARMIQFWYRAKYSRRMAAHIRNIMFLRRINTNAVIIQKVVRRFVARRRVNRIRLRRLHVLVFKYVTHMQCLVRRFLARHRVRRQRSALQIIRTENEQKRLLREQEEQAAKEAKETKELLESADLFLQAQNNNVESVEDIYKGLIGGDPHTPEEIDENGDTLLTIAARLGSMDLLRKTLLWGFDLNHRNSQGLTAPLLAARHNHFQLLQYLFTFLDIPGNTMEPDKVLLLSSEDIGFLFSVAAAQASGSDLSMLQLMFAQSSFISEVNAKAPNTGLTAMHAACEVGNIDAFKLLWKHKAKLDDVDSTGQTPLHKAVTSSVTLTQWILGLDPNFQTYMSDPVRRASILAVDQDGKDCVLLATLAGQNDVLEVLEKVLETTMSAATAQGAGSTSVLRKSGSSVGENSLSIVANSTSLGTVSNTDIGWTAQDVTKALALVLTGNLYCARKLIDGFHFDPNWPEEDTGMTMALTACKIGDIDMIDLLFDLKADFSLADSQGRTVLHYAALLPPPTSANGTNVMVHLFTHGKAREGQITPSLLLRCDQIKQENPVHYAARIGHELSIDLLVGHDLFVQAMNTANDEGMTSLLLGCSYGHEKIVASLMKMGAEPLVVDNNDHGALWHLYHPHPETQRTRLFAGEAPGMVLPVYSPLSTHVVYAECHVVIALLRSGCSLYANYTLSPSELRALPDIPYTGQLSQGTRHTYDMCHEVGDILLQDATAALLKLLLGTANLLMPLDLWRLLLGSLRFDQEKNLKLFQLLWKAGILDVLSTSAAIALQQQQRYSADGGSSMSLTSDNSDAHSVESIAAAVASVVVAPPPHSNAPTSANKRVGRQQSVAGRATLLLVDQSNSPGGGSQQASLIAINTEAVQCARMQEVWFLDMNLTAWVIALHHSKALQYLVKRGINGTLGVDSGGHPVLHWIAKHGTPDMIDVMLADNVYVGSNSASGAANTSSSGAAVASNNGGSSTVASGGASFSGGVSKKTFIRIEQLDRHGYTAAMYAVKLGNLPMAKKLFEYRASSRKALEGKYAAWILAFVRRYERREINTQTGRFGDDDELYFSVAPDPFYATWYQL